MNLKREYQINFWYIIAAALMVLAIRDAVTTANHLKTIPYSDFQVLLSEGRLTDVVVGERRVTGAFKDAAPGQPKHFTSVRVDGDLAQKLASAGVPFSGEPEPGFLQAAISWLLPILGFAAIWMLLIRPYAMGHGGGLMAIGKSRAKVYVEKDTKVTFADVAGVDEAKEELQEVVEFLKNPDAYGRLGAHVPKGVLLVGPPGTGKTLLARAVAGEAGVRFFSISGSEFVEMFVGVGAARVRDLFEQARQQAPAIVFIDELDALGRVRGGVGPIGGHDEKEQTLNQLLTEMDGFDTASGVVLLAATNRPEILDPALLRAGRFDRQVLVDRPDKKGRVDILRVHLPRVTLEPDVEAETISALTPGFTGADLANLVNEAALLATRRRADAVSQNDFTLAIERIVAGLEKKNRILNPRERAVVAHHEMGHAILAFALPGMDPVQKVSIIPRGVSALGYTMQRPTEDRFLMGEAELKNRLVVLLGGRAAEELIFAEASTGAGDDLARATELARSMVARFGMDERLGLVAYEPERRSFLDAADQSDWRPRQYADDTAAAIDEAVRAVLDECYATAVSILTQKKDLLASSAADLLKRETLQGAELARIAALAASGSEPAAWHTTSSRPVGAIPQSRAESTHPSPLSS